MPLVRISPRPGVDSQATQTANSNGHHSANLIRYRRGVDAVWTEKLAGWERLSLHENAATTALGYIRALHPWLDLANNKQMLLGTDGGSQVIVNDTLYDLQISGSTGNEELANFSVTIAGTTVTVGVPTDFMISTGDVITLLMPISIGGRILTTGSSFTVTGTASGSFTFTMSQAATYTETAVVGLPSFRFSLSTPTASQVTFRAHGLIAGQTFTVDQTTQVVTGAVTITIPAGSILTLLTAGTDTFTFDSSSFMSGSGSGTATVYEGTTYSGGSPVFGNVFSVLFGTTGVSGVSQTWFLDNFGEVGLLVYSDSPLLAYQPSGTQPPIGSEPTITIVGDVTPATAPQLNHGMFVAMPQAQVILLGTEPVMGGGQIDPLLLRFSDAGDYTVYEATASNQAGSFRLSRGSKIVGGLQAPQATLIWTDVDCWQLSYIGPPLIYGFTIMGADCGLAAPKAAVSLGRNTFWLGNKGFWRYGDGGIGPLPCSVYDYIFNDLDIENISKAHAGASTSTNEVYFFFPSLTDKPDTPNNLLQFSEQFDQVSAWLDTGLSSITDGFSAPDGTTSAQKITENSAESNHSVAQTIAKESQNVSYTFSVYAHSASTRNIAIRAAGVSGAVIAYFDPTTGATGFNGTTGTDVTLTTVGATTDALATGLAGNGWLRYFITFTSDASSSLVCTVYDANATTDGANFYTGNGGSGAIIWGAQLNLDALATYDSTALSSSNECTRYVKYNALENVWDTGFWPQGQMRTSWVDYNIFGGPLGADSNFRIQVHETGYDDDGDPMEDVFVETGYGAVNDGSQIMLIDQVEPDCKWFGNDGGINVILKSAQYPGAQTVSFGPYSATPTTRFFSTRVRAKLVAARYEWVAVTGFSARIGAMTYRVKPAGSRP